MFLQIKMSVCCATVLFFVSFCAFAQNEDEYTLRVSASIVNSEKKTYGPWKDYPSRSLETLKGFVPRKIKLDKYGGRADKDLPGNGFFTATRDDGRWWLVDPEGHAFVNVGLVNVSPAASVREKDALRKKYGNNANWANKTHQLLLENSFNALGAWSSTELFKNSAYQKNRPLAYTIMKNFMSEYGKQRGGTYQEPGHTGYPDRTIFVFDAEFEKFCDQYAKQLAANKDDKSLFGYFSDNELPFERQSLDRYLAKKDTTDPGCIAAKKWIRERNIQPDQLTDSLRQEFLGLMAEKYYSVVSRAIKKYDPNHLYLGSRLHSYELRVAPFFRATGKYVDVIAINYYGVWTPVKKDMENWTKWSSKPFIITEWYTKGEDSKMTNYSGAGWLVKTQNDRGLFYQNFTLALLESGNCVGFHWFKYQDNDPENKEVDPSNTDANKGVVNTVYKEYGPLLEKMKEINKNIYSLTDLFDNRKQH